MYTGMYDEYITSNTYLQYSYKVLYISIYSNTISLNIHIYTIYYILLSVVARNERNILYPDIFEISNIPQKWVATIGSLRSRIRINIPG
jgi:hypothetical protein